MERRNFAIKLLVEIAGTDTSVSILREVLLRSRKKGAKQAKRWEVLVSMHSEYANTTDKSVVFVTFSHTFIVDHCRYGSKHALVRNNISYTYA